MDDALTTAQLIKHFEDCIENGVRDDAVTTRGKMPQYPMLVLFLGDDAIQGYPAMSRNLMQVWPQYENDLVFVGVRLSKGIPTYVRLTRTGEAPFMQDDAVELIDRVNESNHFKDDSGLLVLYYVLSTTSLTTGEEIDAWIDVTNTIKRDLYIYGDDPIREMLFVLLDEKGRKRRLAGRFRNALSAYCAQEPRSRFRIVLLSNRKKGNKLEPAWDNCLRICTSLIELSNNDDSQVSNVLFDKGIVTVSYVQEKKPVHDIGQVVVGELLDFLAEDDDSSYASSLEGQDLARRLGLTANGTLKLLDDYVDKSLLPMLPSSEEINLFPRWTMWDASDISELTAEELDDLTMDTWSVVIDHIAVDARERVRTDAVRRRRWEKQYQQMLMENFRVGELIYLADHIDDVRVAFGNVREPTKNMDVREYAKCKLSCMLSSDQALVSLFVDVVQKQVDLSREFSRTKDDLRRSLRFQQDVNDANLVEFYTTKVRQFLDGEKGSELRNSFWEVPSIRQLRPLLYDAVDDIINSDPVFRASYEDEQEIRLGRSRGGNAQSVRRNVRNRLSGDNVLTYLGVNFSLGNDLLNAVLLKSGTEFANNLKLDLPSGAYFYDTGYGNGVEVLNVHEVLANNLITREEE